MNREQVEKWLREGLDEREIKWVARLIGYCVMVVSLIELGQDAKKEVHKLSRAVKTIRGMVKNES